MEQGTLVFQTQQELMQWKNDRGFQNHGIRRIYIGSGVKSIPLFCFEQMYDLEAIIFENGLQHIGEYSITGNRIRNLRIPDSVQYISHCAFCEDKYLEHVDLGNGVILLEDYVFPQCERLKKLSLPPSLICIDAEAFGNSEIEQLIVRRGSVGEDFARKQGMAYASWGAPLETEGRCGDAVRWLYDKESKTLSITGTGKMWDYGWRKRAPWRVFPVKRVILGEGVETIGRCAFLLCLTLKEVVLPESMRYISDSAFHHCVSLLQIDAGQCAGNFYVKEDCFYQDGRMLMDFEYGMDDYVLNFSPNFHLSKWEKGEKRRFLEHSDY